MPRMDEEERASIEYVYTFKATTAEECRQAIVNRFFELARKCREQASKAQDKKVRNVVSMYAEMYEGVASEILRMKIENGT